MSRKPNIKNLSKLFENGKDFKLTDSQYEKLTGRMLPKDKYYIKNRSALAKEAKERGYEVEVIEKTVVLRKKW